MGVRELFDLSGRAALITGGARGIGHQIAEALAEMGADVALCGRHGEECERTAAEIASAYGVRTFGGRCDVRSETEVEAFVHSAKERLGRIDILVNNAGTVWSAWPEETALEGWAKVIDVNLTGTFLVARAVGREMIEAGNGGKIINIASTAAFGGAPPEIMNAIAYQASKGGVVSFTRDLACKWARHRINVNAIAPGWFPTDMTASLLAEHLATLKEHIPLRRVGGPDDLKGAAVYLASAASDFVTGHTLIVDGGQSAW